MSRATLWCWRDGVTRRGPFTVPDGEDARDWIGQMWGIDSTAWNAMKVWRKDEPCVQEDVEVHVINPGTDDAEAALVCEHCGWERTISGMRPKEVQAHLDAHLVVEDQVLWQVRENPLIAAYHRMYDWKDEQVRGGGEFASMAECLRSLGAAMELMGIPKPERYDKERS